MAQRLHRDFRETSDWFHSNFRLASEWLDACASASYLINMAIREIITVPDRRLKTISTPVAEVDDAVRALMDDMLDTMYDANGIGLAAIQIAVPSRIIVMDLSSRSNEPDHEPDPEDDLEGTETGPRYFVNPEIIWTSEETRNYQEGCLSVPGFFDDVERPDRCTVRYLDYDGRPQELPCSGLLATCIQHEMDHLNGIVFLDHLSRLKRDRAIRRLRKEAREADEGISSGA